MLKPMLLSAAAAAMAFVPAVQAQPSYVVTNLAELAPAGSYVTWIGLNNAGDLAGQIGGNPATYLNGVLATYAAPRQNDGQVGIARINNSGTVAISWESFYYPTTSYLLQNGTYKQITPLYPNLSERNTRAAAINDSGAVALSASGTVWECGSNIGCEGGYYRSRAAVYANGKTTELGGLGAYQAAATDINNTGVVVGWSQATESSRTQAYIHDHGQVQFLGNGSAVSINDAGQVLGNDGDNSWFYDNGTMTQLHGSKALDLNNAGQAIGEGSWDSGGAWIYTGGQKFSLTSLLAEPGWRVSDVYDINDKGQILAQAYAPGAQYPVSVLLSPVPEPATYGMLAAGLGIVSLWRRQRRA